MVLRLAEALGASLREANELLHAAGLAAAYPRAELASPDLAAYLAAIEHLLAAHEPYPAMALDARYTVLAANQACTALFGPRLVGSNFVRDALADPAAAQTIINWPEVAWAGLDRLRQDAQRSPFDPELRSLICVAEAALDGVSRPPPAEGGFMVCPWFRIGSTVVRTIAMTARFDHIAEVTLDELRIELMYPLDDEADRFFRTPRSQTHLPPQARRAPAGLPCTAPRVSRLPDLRLRRLAYAARRYLSGPVPSVLRCPGTRGSTPSGGPDPSTLAFADTLTDLLTPFAQLHRWLVDCAAT